MTAASLAAGGAALLALAGSWELTRGLGSRRRSRARPGPAGVAGALLRRLARLATHRFAWRMSLDSTLEAAGEPYGFGAREWLGAKLIGSGVAASAALPAAGAAPGRTAPLLLATAPAAGFLAPDLWLRHLARSRIAHARRDLPDMLDLLRVTVEAGLPLVRALGAVAAEFPGPLAAEWRRVSVLTGLGEPLDRSLEGLDRRLPCDDVRALSRTMRDSRRYGTPLGSILAAQATRARHRRRQRIRESAARAGPKVQLVVALILVPSVLLVVAAALLTSISSAGLGLPS